ncbi:MAG: type II toxin-antitoxin system RelE/ParE family toxin [Methanosarcinales archaeon Met12]|nr:MAG: type II toxin-antitoxin system RelE/ParE family toxin [Methanosarcinales archaeon Met12]
MFEVVILKSVQHKLKKAPNEVRERCFEVFEALQHTFAPLGYDIKKLKGHSMAFRIRIGDWRITYEVLKKEKEVIIHDIRQRKKGYKR